ncbi:MAG: hypothetical protein RDU13_12145 [Elusimicrobiales bacterium]|nr:hypothetical protein [Elusimicrobiales bacterium]
MSNYGVEIIVAAVLAAFGVAAWFSYKRRKDLERFAAANGLSFDPSASAVAGLPYGRGSLFDRGRHARKNLIRAAGPGGGEMYFFDYSYTTGSGKNSRTYRFGVAMLAGAPASLPAFELRPENFLDRIAEMAGFRDIDLPQFPVFSKAYRLTGEDAEGLTRIFSAGPAALLEGRRGLMMNGGAGRLTLMRKGYVSAADYPGFIEEARAVFTSFLSN